MTRAPSSHPSSSLEHASAFESPGAARARIVWSTAPPSFPLFWPLPSDGASRASLRRGLLDASTAASVALAGAMVTVAATSFTFACESLAVTCVPAACVAAGGTLVRGRTCPSAAPLRLHRRST